MQKSDKEEEQEKTARAIEEFLANGGKITHIPSGMRSDQVTSHSGGWGRKKKVVGAAVALAKAAPKKKSK